MKTIRVISRAVAVLRTLEQSPGQSLASLAAATQLPKASLLRVLASLELEGLVWRAIGDGLYRNRVSISELSAGHLRHYRLAELATPVLQALQRRVVWPSDLAVRQDYAMEMVETSRRLSSLSLVREALGFRIDMLMSAVGAAYLAFCPEEESREIVEHLRAHPGDCVNPQRVTLAGSQRLIEETRLRGYGLRDPRYGGSHLGLKAFDDGLSSIAVPILVDGNHVLGCLTIVWLKRFNLEREVVRMHLPELKEAAKKVAAAWSQGRHHEDGVKP